MSQYIPARVRALEVYRAILGDPTQVVFTRPKIVTKTGTTAATELAAQTVRISSTVDAKLVESAAGLVPMRTVEIFGVRDHPTAADTDIKEGYEFALDGDKYRVSEIILEPGEIRAHVVVSG